MTPVDGSMLKPVGRVGLTEYDATAPPPTVGLLFSIAILGQYATELNVYESPVGAPGSRVTVPDAVIWQSPFGVVAVTVYVPDAVGIPVIVNVPLLYPLVNPAGNPLTVAPVAPPPIA